MGSLECKEMKDDLGPRSSLLFSNEISMNSRWLQRPNICYEISFKNPSLSPKTFNESWRKGFKILTSSALRIIISPSSYCFCFIISSRLSQSNWGYPALNLIGGTLHLKCNLFKMGVWYLWPQKQYVRA